MIKVTILTGPYAGREREMPEWVEPKDLLWGLSREDTRWRVDYSQATPDEVIAWGRVDMFARIMAALLHGRFVRFEDPTGPREWCAGSVEEAARMGQEAEDAVVASGMMVGVKSDDDQGVVIGTAGPEQKVQ